MASAIFEYNIFAIRPRNGLYAIYYHAELLTSLTTDAIAYRNSLVLLTGLKI